MTFIDNLPIARRRRPAHDSVMLALRASPILRSLPDHEIAGLRRAVREHRVRAGDAVIGEHDAERRFYVVVSGTAAVGGTQLGPSDHVGEIAAIDGRPRTATVVALTDMRLVSMAHFELTSLVRRHPEVGFELMKHLCELLRRRTPALRPVTSSGNDHGRTWPAGDAA